MSTDNIILETIQDCPIYQHPDGHLSWLSDCDIDNDGSGGNPEGDPYHQDTTTLRHFDGTYLNAQTENYIVIPGGIAQLVGPVVMGCKARVHYRRTGKVIDAVVGDDGPTFKVGEASVHCAKDLDMDPSPINGGESAFDMVLFEIWPGVPAVVNGITYPLQAA